MSQRVSLGLIPILCLGFCSTNIHSQAAPAAPKVFACTHPEYCTENGGARKIPVVGISGNRLLLAVGDTIYSLGPEGQTLWKYATEGWDTIVSSPVFNPDLNEVAFLQTDGLVVRLNAQTGAKSTGPSIIGKASYSDIKPFGRQYLFLADRVADDGNGQPGTDRLYCAGPEGGPGWSMDFPRGAKLEVVGQTILAVKYGRSSVSVQRIVPPHR
jgi:hypothetical protein